MYRDRAVLTRETKRPAWASLSRGLRNIYGLAVYIGVCEDGRSCLILHLLVCAIIVGPHYPAEDAVIAAWWIGGEA